MPTRTIAGRTLAWREAGPEDGEPALLSHCALAHSGAFVPLMERLADRLAMRALDLPDHGGTGRDPALGLQEQAVADLAALMPAEPAHLIGHSFGGTAALRLAVEQPARVRSLTLIEPVFFSLLADAGHPAYAAELAAGAPFHAAIRAGDRERAAAAFLGRWGADGGLDALPAAQRAYILPRIGFIAAGEPDVLGRDAPGLRLADLRRVACPVLAIAGAASPPVIAAILDVIGAAIPGLRRRTVPGAGHMVPLTHPDAVSGALRDFLALDRC